MGELRPVGSQLSSTTSQPSARSSCGITRAADRIDGIDHHAEPAAAHRLGIDQRERQHLTDVLVVVGFAHEHAAQRIHLGKETVLLGQRQHALPWASERNSPFSSSSLRGIPI